MKSAKCLVTREYPDVNFVLDLIHSAKGIAVMAHPFLYNNIDLLKELIEAGKIDGIEVNHYSNNEEQKTELIGLAEKNDLIITGGSDFHGLYNSTITHIGSQITDEENLDKLCRKINANAQKSSRSLIKL